MSVVLVIVTIGIVGLASLLLLGRPIPRILSTVGASVGGAPVGDPGAKPGPGPDTPEGPDPDPGRVALLELSRPDLLIIKTGTLDLQVDAVPAAVTEATDAIEALGGYVAGSEQTGDGDDVTASLTFRIPAERWTDALEALRGLALDVIAEHTGTEDVTGEVVDLRARIANLQATELALQGIMSQAKLISDVLEVQDELTHVRGEIEAATAERQRLEEQAAYSTLAVRFGVEPEPAVATVQERFDPATEVDQATANLVEILQALATAGIWFGIVWLPILLALGLVAFVSWLVLRRLRPGRPEGWAGSGVGG
ncbi:MAG TPA: DUF4349 domain-containing protein [Candidatus Limnocylindrales bacterium]|nr:DUF4349 domain-containing protein [Candidatus Limnocylindrales bacterium]